MKPTHLLFYNHKMLLEQGNLSCVLDKCFLFALNTHKSMRSENPITWCVQTNKVCQCFLYDLTQSVNAKHYDEDLRDSDEDEHDAYLEKMKAEGAEREEDSDSEEGEQCPLVVCITVNSLLTHTSLKRTPL